MGVGGGHAAGRTGNAERGRPGTGKEAELLVGAMADGVGLKPGGDDQGGKQKYPDGDGEESASGGEGGEAAFLQGFEVGRRHERGYGCGWSEVDWGCGEMTLSRIGR